MPIIEFDPNYLKRKFNLEIDLADLPYLKAELDEIKDNIWKVEIKDTERLDLWSVFGIVRELKGRKGIELGLFKKVGDKNLTKYIFP